MLWSLERWGRWPAVFHPSEPRKRQERPRKGVEIAALMSLFPARLV